MSLSVSGLLPLIAVWYSFSLMAIYSAKIILNSCACAASLCALQLGAAAVGCLIVARLSPKDDKDHDRHGSIIPPIGAAESRIVYVIAASYASGFALTNTAMELAPPSFVETVKSSEPLSTVALAAIFLRERERPLTLVSLVPLVLGVAMASGFGEGHLAAAFSLAGMLLALASNVCFSGRAVATKALLRAHPRSALMHSDIALFYHVSRLGAILLLPIAALVDARTLLAALFEGAARSGGGTGDDGGGGGGAIGDGGAIGGGGGIDGGAIGGGGRIDGSQGNLSAASADASSVAGADGHLAPPILLLMLLLNGATHAMYNAISFAVLNRVSVATHAVLNIMRRVVLIAATAAIFGTAIDSYNWLGIAICVMGGLAFAFGKQQPSRPARAGASQPARLHAV
jgi:drug/metabolite transporter (DMT)-like permease